MSKKVRINYNQLIIALAALVISSTISIYQNQIACFIDLTFRHPTLKECLKKDSIRSGRHHFAVCRTWSTIGGEYFHAYIYDGSDQIAQSHLMRSNEWTSMVKRYANSRPYYQLTDMGYSIKKTGDHIYKLDFDRELPPEI